jgi:methylated-DNA-[protein]-cysteine S-methyltransferase
MYYTTFDTPIGELLVAGDAGALTRIDLPRPDGSRHSAPSGLTADAAPLRPALEQLDAYFSGELTEFALPLAPAGTAFQQRVWSALQSVPFGRTASYGQVAKTVGRPGAARAVGLANNRNPIPLIIPCHRIVGSNGNLVGYGGGLACKRWLLEHERRVLRQRGELERELVPLW